MAWFTLTARRWCLTVKVACLQVSVCLSVFKTSETTISYLPFAPVWTPTGIRQPCVQLERERVGVAPWQPPSCPAHRPHLEQRRRAFSFKPKHFADNKFTCKGIKLCGHSGPVRTEGFYPGLFFFQSTINKTQIISVEATLSEARTPPKTLGHKYL